MTDICAFLQHSLTRPVFNDVGNPGQELIDLGEDSGLVLLGALPASADHADDEGSILTVLALLVNISVVKGQ